MRRAAASTSKEDQIRDDIGTPEVDEASKENRNQNQNHKDDDDDDIGDEDDVNVTKEADRW